MTFISVLFFSVGFVRLELQLKAQKERILALEKIQQTSKTVKDTTPLKKGKQFVVVEQLRRVARFYEFYGRDEGRKQQGRK